LDSIEVLKETRFFVCIVKNKKSYSGRMKDYKVFLEQKNETWKQALERFQNFCEADMKDYFSTKDYSYHFADNKSYALYHTGKVSSGYLAGLASMYNINIPDELEDMLDNYGTFRIGDTLLEIYNDSGSETILTLPLILEKYGFKDIIEKIGPGMLKSLSNFYYFFGVSFPKSPEITFLYFSKAGNFGKMLFSPHNQDLVLRKILPSMFNGSIDKYSLSSLISNQVDRVIINALTVKGYIG